MEEWSDALRELSDLPMGQRRLLKYLAHPKTASQYLQSHEVSHALSMPPSSISTALNRLTEKDYIEQDAEVQQYQIINPLLLAVVQGEED